MFNFSIRCFFLCALFFASTVLADNAKFELSLDELQKPSLPAVAKKPEKRQPVAKPKIATAGSTAKAAAEASKKSAAVANAKDRPHPPQKSVKPVEVAKTAVAQTNVNMIIEDVILKDGLPCWFAGQVAGVLTAAVAASPLLDDFRLAPVAVSTYKGATVATVCGLPAAESHTLARLLQMRNLDLLNISGTESGEVVLQKVLDSFGFSYAAEETTKGRNYLVYFDGEPESVLRLVIK